MSLPVSDRLELMQAIVASLQGQAIASEVDAQTPPSILERMGGYPEDLLEGPTNLSDRDVRRALIQERVQLHYSNRPE